MEYFKDSKLACPCCGELIFSDSFRFKLNQARFMANVPFIINSGYRCEKHNLEPKVGGSPTSSHPKGLAVDIRTKNSRERYLVLIGLIAANIHRIGICKEFVHADDDPDKPPNLIWMKP